MKSIFQVTALYVWVLAVVVAVGIALGFVGLWWLPYQQNMETRITRLSNGYVTAQQEALRQFRSDYTSAATAGQRAAIVLQMREIADKIPGYVQPDIAVFLASR